MYRPKRVVADSGFVIRGLGQRRNEGRSAACREAWSTLLGAGCEILIPTPIIAELARSKDPLPVPRTRQIIPVPFDVDAADHLAKLGALTYPKGKEVGYWKYDMLIAACAAMSGAEFLISIDGDYLVDPLTKVLDGLRVLGPEDFLDPQAALEMPDGKQL
jgi:hypothetical protein